MSTRRVSPVALEETAELADLRDQADRTADAAARTLVELSDRLRLVSQPGIIARRVTAGGRAAVSRALREVPGRISNRRGVWRSALAVLPVLAVAVTAAAVARQRANSDATSAATIPLPERVARLRPDRIFRPTRRRRTV